MHEKPDATDEPAPAKSVGLTVIPTAPQTEDKTTDNPSAKARWRAQQIVTRKAEANYQNARLTREIAEFAVLEYAEGIFNQDLATVEGEIKLAESNLQRSKDRLDWARRMFKKGYVAKSIVVSEELALKKARFSLEQAQSKKKVLVDYTKPKTIKELKSEVEKARSDELAKKATWELEIARRKSSSARSPGRGQPAIRPSRSRQKASGPRRCCERESRLSCTLGIRAAGRGTLS